VRFIAHGGLGLRHGPYAVFRWEIVKATGIRNALFSFNSVIIILSFLEIENHARNKKKSTV